MTPLNWLATLFVTIIVIGFVALFQYMFRPGPTLCRWCDKPCKPRHTLCDKCRQQNDHPNIKL